MTTWNGTREVLVEPSAQQYQWESSGTWPFLGQVANGSVYATESALWLRDEDENGTATVKQPTRLFNESGQFYLWEGWREQFYVEPYQFVSENVTFERAGTEQFRGETVMRYETSGADAHPEAAKWAASENDSIDRFSVSLLLGTDGVIRQYRVEYAYTLNEKKVNTTFVHTVTDVGATDVERPEWATNESATVGT